MIEQIANTPSFKADLAAQKAGRGQKGFHVGSDVLKATLLPLTTHLLDRWKEDSKDSTALSLAKSVARGLTYFFTLVTFAPAYQALYGIPKKLIFSRTNTQYAKATLEALNAYNTLRNQVIRDGDHTRRFLAPENIETRSDEFNRNNGQLVINLSDAEQARVRANIDALKREKQDHYDVVLNRQVTEIVAYLKGLTPADRLIAHREILNAFLTHVGFDDLFIDDAERLEFALELSNKVALALIAAELNSVVDKLARNHNFITVNETVDKLSTEAAELFGIDPDLAKTIVAQSLKEAMTKKFGSFEACARETGKHIYDVASTDEEEKKFQVFLDSLKHNYQDVMVELQGKYDDLRGAAVVQDADESLAILNQDIKALQREQLALKKELTTINGQLRVLGKKGRYYHLTKITKTKAELIQAKKEKKEAYDLSLQRLNDKLRELSQINHGKDVNLNGPEIQDLKRIASGKLETMRQVQEVQANLGIKNKRAFRACFQMLHGVDVTRPAEQQVKKVSTLAKQLTDQTRSFATTRESIAKFLGFGEKLKPVQLFETLQDQFATFEPDSRASRDALRTTYEQMSPAQQAHFAQEVASQAGVTAGFIKGPQVQFGKAYISAYVDGEVDEVNGVAVDPSIIKRVVQSEAGKKAALYKGWTGFNDFWWRESARA